MMPSIQRSGDAEETLGSAALDLEDDRTRNHLQCILQYLQSKGLMETLCALSSETGIQYEDGDLPEAGILEASMDMFSRYRGGLEKAKTGDDLAEEALLKVERGACCVKAAGEPQHMGMNVTAVCWVASSYTDMALVVATADRRLRVIKSDGDLLAELTGLASPILGLDAAPVRDVLVSSNDEAGEEPKPSCRSPGRELLGTSMGGETLLLHLSNASGGYPTDATRVWALEVAQKFSDHTKHTTTCRFAPLGDKELDSGHFITISRDHKAMLYKRQEGSPDFSLLKAVQLIGEGTACCWVSPNTFALTARDDHNLIYWDVAGDGPDGKAPCQRLKTNLNALGDTIVSFTVLALAVSSDNKVIACCTDKSRIIVLPVFSATQLRNLYGAVIESYDVPSICFSLDRSFLYATSSLPPKQITCAEEKGVETLCGEVAVFEVQTGEIVMRLPCHSKPVRCMSRHPFAEKLATGSFDKTIRFWD